MILMVLFVIAVIGNPSEEKHLAKVEEIQAQNVFEWLDSNDLPVLKAVIELLPLSIGVDVITDYKNYYVYSILMTKNSQKPITIGFLWIVFRPITISISTD